MLFRSAHAATSSVGTLLRERVARIDATRGRRAGGGGEALLIARELAVAGIAPHASLQAISIVCRMCLGGRGCYGDQGGERCESEDDATHFNLLRERVDGNVSELGSSEACHAYLGVGGMPCVRDVAHHDAAGGQQCDLRHSSRWGSGPIVADLRASIPEN